MKTIVAGIDFTNSSHNAAKYAAMLADKFKCKLVLFNMFDVPMIHSNSGLYFMSYSSIRESSSEQLARFQQKLQKEFPRLSIGSFVTTGSFKSEIIAFIKKHQVQAVVMGLVAKNRFAKFLYGSHSTDLAGKVSAPVIIVPEQYKVHNLKKVLLGVDNGEKLHKSSIKPVELMLKTMKAGIQLLHVRTEDEIFDHVKKRELKINGRKQIVEVISESSLERGMRKFTVQNKVDLIAIISRKHSAFYNLFNESNTKNIAFSSKVPVMAIHE